MSPNTVTVMSTRPAGSAFNPLEQLFRTGTSLALGYMRWTQLVPMILVWGFAVIMVGALVLTLFSTQADRETQDSVLRWIISLPYAEATLRAFDAWIQEQRAAEGGFDISRAIFQAWGILAAVLFVLGLVLSLFGVKRPEWSLSKKLKFAALAAGAMALLLCGLLLGHGDDFTSGPAALLGFGPMVAIMLWLPSAWSLTVSHGIGWVERAMFHAAEGDTLPGSHPSRPNNVQ